MLRIPCPFCGPRDHSEFDYAGDATVEHPALDAPIGDWVDAVYVRDDPKGTHTELWRHTRGCRCWLAVRRDTLTHEIASTWIVHPGLAAALAEETT